MLYEDNNILCVAHNIQCCIRFVINDIVCGTCNILCYIRHRTSDIRYCKLQHHISKHTIYYVQRTRCCNTILYVLIYDIATYDIVCQNILYCMSTLLSLYDIVCLTYCMLAIIQMICKICTAQFADASNHEDMFTPTPIGGGRRSLQIIVT